MRELNKRTRKISGIVNTINVIANAPTSFLSMLPLKPPGPAMPDGASRSWPRRSEISLIGVPRRRPNTQIVRALQEATREATDSANQGARVAEESNRQSELRAGRD